MICIQKGALFPNNLQIYALVLSLSQTINYNKPVNIYTF